jgi:hypothetical protein
MHSNYSNYTSNYMTGRTNGLLEARPTEKQSPKPFVFGQTEVENAQFTFRDLHNISPQPPRTFSKPSKSPESPSSASQSSTARGLTPNTHQTDGLQRTIEALTASLSLYPSLSITQADDESSGQYKESEESATQHNLRAAANLKPSTHVTDPPKTPYDIRDEPAPNEPFYSTTFQSSIRAGSEIALEADEALTEICASHNIETLNHLKQMAKDLTRNQISETKTIAVLGDSGEGRQF